MEAAVISAVAHEGLAVEAASGEPAFLAVVDSSGKVIESGPQVARLAYDVSVACFKNFLKGHGHLRVYKEPPAVEATPCIST